MIKAVPFTWEGNKRAWAKVVWERLGNPDTYVEPFAGSAALLMMRPRPYGKREVLVDNYGLICNFWRAVSREPDVIAEKVQTLAIQNDVKAVYKYIRRWAEDSNDKLMNDRLYYDADVAGWWCWISNLTTGQETVSFRFQKGFVSPFSPREKGQRHDPLQYFRLLKDRMRWVYVLNGDWTLINRKSVLHDYGTSVALAVDPPYLNSYHRYPTGGRGVSDDAYRWCIEHGERYRIVFFCSDGDYDLPTGWTCETMGRSSAMGGHPIPDEIAMFSPACIEPQPSLF